MPLPPLVEPVAALGDAERARTARHTRLAGLGAEGQRRIAAAHVAVVGAGGLGSPAVLALAAAGIGTLTVIDDDRVELANLQRQVMHRLEDVGRPKADSAVRVARELSETRVVAVRERLTAANAERMLADADVVIDGTDTFASRELVAAACEALGLPLVWGTVQEFAGQATVFWSQPPAPAEPVVLADLYPPGSEAPSCSVVGVFGPLCLQVGSILAGEALKLAAGIGDPLLGRLLLVDALKGTTRDVPLRASRMRDAPPSPAVGASVAEVDEPGDAVVIDVREADELATAGVFPGARHIPLGELLADPSAIEGPVVVVCEAGIRARRAALALQGAGVDASVLAGGFRAWSRRTAGVR